MSDYDDIINLPHHTSLKHSRMSMENRAAQFAPFAALTGHKEAILETERITEDKKCIDESLKEEINNELIKIVNNNDIIVNVKYFIKDKNKSGGRYTYKVGKIKKIDKIKKIVIFEDKITIFIDDIIEINEIGML